MNKVLLHLLHFIQHKKHMEERERGLRRTLEVYNRHFKKAFSKKQALIWGLCSGSVRMICNTKVTSFIPLHFSSLWPQPWEGWDQKRIRALLSLFFLSHHWDTASQSISDFFQLVAELRSEAGGRDEQIPLEKLWYSQDSIQHQTDQVKMYSHASSGLQQWSTCITYNTCKTASLCFHCDERLNHIISC